MGSPSESRKRDGDAAADQVALVADLLVGVRVADAHRASGPPARRAGDGLTGGLVGGHPERRDERLATVGRREGGSGRVDAGESPRRLERPREDRVEVDGGADLAELAGAVRLGARLLESRGEVSVEPSRRTASALERVAGGVARRCRRRSSGARA